MELSRTQYSKQVWSTGLLKDRTVAAKDFEFVPCSNQMQTRPGTTNVLQPLIAFRSNSLKSIKTNNHSDLSKPDFKPIHSLGAAIPTAGDKSTSQRIAL